MVNNSSRQKWDRLSQKNLDTQFVQEMIRGLRTSPFEATAILDSVYKIYGPLFETTGSLKPGQILFQVLHIDNSAATPLAASRQITVTLTFDDPQEDLEARRLGGVVGLRQHRLQRMANEAFQQDGVLTVEDLANRLLNCGERTICRDLQQMRKRDIAVPLRSTITDMGRTLSHRALIVREWLRGKEYSEIARSTFHSVASVKNYVEKFKRVVLLSAENYDVHTIGFLVRLSPALVEEYHRLLADAPIVRHRKRELTEARKKSASPPTARRRSTL